MAAIGREGEPGHRAGVTLERGDELPGIRRPEPDVEIGRAGGDPEEVPIRGDREHLVAVLEQPDARVGPDRDVAPLPVAQLLVAGGQAALGLLDLARAQADVGGDQVGQVAPAVGLAGAGLGRILGHQRGLLFLLDRSDQAALLHGEADGCAEQHHDQPGGGGGRSLVARHPLGELGHGPGAVGLDDAPFEVRAAGPRPSRTCSRSAARARAAMAFSQIAISSSGRRERIPRIGAGGPSSSSASTA